MTDNNKCMCYFLVRNIEDIMIYYKVIQCIEKDILLDAFGITHISINEEWKHVKSLDDYDKCKRIEIKELLNKKKNIKIKYEFIILDNVLNFDHNIRKNKKNEIIMEEQFLTYFLLIRNIYLDKVFINFLCSNEKTSYSISHYMIIESLWNQKTWKIREQKKFVIKKGTNDGYDSILINGNKRLNINGINSFKQYIPLLRLNYTTYNILSSNFSDLFTKSQFIDKNQSLKEMIIDENILFFIGTDKRINERIIDSDLYTEILAKVVIKKVITSLFSKAGLFDNDNELEMFTSMIEHMSILGVLFMAVYCKNLELKNKIDFGNILELINISEDFSEGILQIIENAVEYAQDGYLTFRIRNGKKHMAYLEKNYSGYEIKKEISYLEIIITDYSNTDIVSEFTNKKIVKSDLVFHDLTLTEMFENNKGNNVKNWKKFYERVENVTHHYGLKYFFSIVKSANGYFKVESSKNVEVPTQSLYSNYDNAQLSSYIHLPGTEYKILLPVILKKDNHPSSVGIGVQPNYNDIIISNNWLPYDCDITNIKKQFDSQSDKETEVNKFAEMLIREFPYSSNRIIKIDMCNNFNDKIVEIIAKGLIYYIYNDNDYLDKRIAIIGVNRTFLVNFTRSIAIFYNNNINNSKMGKVQIYLIDDNYENEIILGGKTLNMSYQTLKYMSYTKGQYNDCLDIIEKSLFNSKQIQIKKKDLYKITPFDLVIKKDNMSIFENKVKKDLESDIQKKQFGCSLFDSHMRVGSKMHITNTFYDATLLFASSYYISRFAYLLSLKINETISNKKSDVLLIGYETYSEMMIEEIESQLKQNFKYKNVYSTIFEQSRSNPFKYLDDFPKNRAWQCIIIVPINSTLTTHSKISAELKRREMELTSNDKYNIKMNIGVIVIRDSDLKSISKYQENINREILSSIESNYWEELHSDERKIITKINDPKEVNYNILVSNEWESPLECKSCFSDEFIDEKPLMELNKASVIPMILEGLNEDEKEFTFEKKESPGDISLLKDCFMYGHLKHAGNHFAYYVETEKLMSKIKKNSSKSFNDWTRKISKAREKQNSELFEKNKDIYIYDILVAPLHSNNAIFVEYINKHVFNSVPLIINIDSNREYRDNIKMKYSNLTYLYENLMLVNQKAVINFHYIDDSINSGNTFYRTKSLISSLFPKEAFKVDNKVKVNLFKNIILLLNRCSTNSILNYVESISNYFSFIDLYISSLRTHREKSCSLCSLVEDYENLRKCSSTNEIADRWNFKIYKNKLRTIDELDDFYKEQKDLNLTNEKRLEVRYYNRLYCSHMISKELSKLTPKDKNDNRIIERKLINFMVESIENNNDNNEYENFLDITDKLISFIKCASRPFIVYRKSVLFAINKIILKLLDYFIRREEHSNSEYYEEYKIIYEFIDFLWENKNIHLDIKKCLEDLYIVLISQSSYLGAKYIIRKENIKKIMDVNKELNIENFFTLYISQIKRILTLNRDETIDLWIEYLLKTGNEYQNVDKRRQIDNDFLECYGIDSEFGKHLYFENSHVIFDAIEELSHKLKDKDNDNEYKDLLRLYYFENFNALINFNEICETNNLKNMDLDIFDKNIPSNIEQIKDMVKLYSLLKKDEINDNKIIEYYYKDLAKRLNKVASGESTIIYGYDKNNKEPMYMISKTAENKELLNNSLIKIIKETESKENTNKTIIYDSKGKNIIILRFINTRKISLEKRYDMDSIYIVIKYHKGLSKNELKWNIRNILIFRKLLVERFYDTFHNNLFRVFRDNQNLAKLLGYEKSANHSSYESIEYSYKLLNEARNENISILSQLLKMTSDSLISKLYVESIKSNEKIYGEYYDEISFDINKYKTILEEIFSVKENNLAENPTKAKIHFLENGKSVEKIDETRWSVPIRHTFFPLLIVSSLVHNATKHGFAKDNKILLKIYLERENKKEYLVFENKARSNFEINPLGNNIKGITIPAIKYYFHCYLHREVIIMNLNDNFIIKLPIRKVNN